jgi:Ca2+-binding RTX toxin-like protein
VDPTSDDIVTCTVSGATRLLVDMGPGPDFTEFQTWTITAVQVEIHGGEGDDSQLGGTGLDDHIDGGPGDDELFGFAGDDVLQAVRARTSCTAVARRTTSTAARASTSSTTTATRPA